MKHFVFGISFLLSDNISSVHLKIVDMIQYHHSLFVFWNFLKWLTLLHIIHVSVFMCFCLVPQSCPTLCDLMDYCPPESSVNGNFPGKNTYGCHALLQRIFPTQGLNPSLPHCRQILYGLSHKGSPGILVWVAYPFSRGSSWPRNWTGVSCIAGGFTTSWATRKAPLSL